MSRTRIWGLFGLLAFIWGSTWLVIKVGLADLPPFLAAGLRFALAAACLAALARARRIRLPRRRGEHALLLVVGMTTISASYGIVYWAEQYIPSGLTAVLFATHPFFTLILAHLVLAAERITAPKALGVTIGFLGVLLVFRGDLTIDDPRGATAAAIFLLAPFISAAGNVMVKRWGTHLHPFQLSILPMAYGAAALLGTSLVVEGGARAEWSPVAVGSVMYLALLGSVVTFVGYYTLLKEVPVTTLNLLAYVYPLVAVALGYAVLGEVLDRPTLVGGALVLTGIAVATWRRRRGVTRPGRESPATGVGR